MVRFFTAESCARTFACMLCIKLEYLTVGLNMKQKNCFAFKSFCTCLQIQTYVFFYNFVSSENSLLFTKGRKSNLSLSEALSSENIEQHL